MLVAVCPVTSVTRYVTGVFVPDVIDDDAVNVAIPVVWSMDHVPSPVTVSVLPQTDVAGLTMHGPFVEPVCSPVPDASADVPMTLVKETEAPAMTLWVSGEAMGAVGAATVGVIVALSYWPSESVA